MVFDHRQILSGWELMIMRLGRLFAGVVASTVLAAGAAQAAVVFSDNFDTEGGGATVLNYGTAIGNFANWTVSEGTVDVVFSGDYSTEGGGVYVDLDGSTSNAGIITSIQSFAVTAGQQVTLEWDIAGNMRDCCDANDDFFGAFVFAGPTSINGYQSFGAWGVSSGTDYSNIIGISSSTGVAQNSPWQHYGLSFVAASAGTFQIQFGNRNSFDNIGPLLDNVQLSVGAVPEPATWAMMIMGFGLAGAVLRRRNALAA